VKCPKCKHNSEVLETIQRGTQTKRRRRCLSPSCQFRFASYETAEGDAITTSSTSRDSLPEWLERVRSRPGVDKEALIAAYSVDRRRKEIEREQRRRARAERETDYDEEPPLTKEELMREIRGY
jgi:transcriptional regulator NrdR family protein